MVNAERCMLMTKVPQEKEVEQGTEIENRPNWPEQGKIEFKNLSLQYRPETPLVLKNLTFNVKQGDKIGIVGRTGAGKSTICLCLSRILEPTNGQIIVDGVDISKLNLTDLRSRITVIPQDPIMFKGTLRYNLDPSKKVDEQEILRVLEEAQLGELIKQDGLDLKIDENGSNLSSGEKQLICICRAILRKSKVVILDEATSNIDVVTEQKIQHLLNTCLDGCTVLTVAHRLNTIMNSQKILVLSFGEIAEYDSPRNLMQNKESEFTKLLTELKQKDKN